MKIYLFEGLYLEKILRREILQVFGLTFRDGIKWVASEINLWFIDFFLNIR